MVDSLSSIKIRETASDADETDTVACIAAVTAYLKLEEEEQAELSKVKTGKPPSPWGQASLIEGAQVFPAVQAAGNQRQSTPLWRNFPGFLLIALSLAGLACGVQKASAGTATTMKGAPAFSAQPQALPQINANSSGSPIFDPAFDTNVTADADADITYTAQGMPSRAASGWRPYSVSQDNRYTATNGKVPVKVALAINVGEISVDAIDGAQVLDMSTGKPIALLQSLSQWRLSSRTTSGAPAIAMTGRREVDKYLIATGDQLKTNERNVAFFPSQFIGPPALKAFANAQQNAAPGSAQKKPAGPALIISCLPRQNSQSIVSNTSSPAGLQSLPRSANPTTQAQSEDVLPEDEEEGIDQDPAADTIGSAPPPRSAIDPAQFSGITNGIIITPDQNTAESSQYVFSLNGRMYRGSLWIKPSVVKDKNGAAVTRLTAINVLDLEDYLMSVLPSEMPSSWPREALKAQAIAARSYAIANLGKYKSQGFDVKATVLDQAYRGAVAETISTNKAVAETRGIVMKHAGKVVPGFFHSSSAGHTDVAEHVWTKEVPYLKSVPDLDHKSKYVLWERKFAMPQIDNLLGKDVGTVLALFPVHRSPAGRVKNLLVIGTKGSTFVSGTSVRQLFSLPSTNFNVLAYQDAYLFKGQGFGHGLGLSQYGARSLAEHGYNAAQILTYYYKDVTFEHIVVTPAL